LPLLPQRRAPGLADFVAAVDALRVGLQMRVDGYSPEPWSMITQFPTAHKEFMDLARCRDAVDRGDDGAGGCGQISFL